MRKIVSVFFIFLFVQLAGQNAESTISKTSLFYDLKRGDSVIVYQCHVEDAVQQIMTASGQTISGTSKKSTITEKYVIRFEEGTYLVNYYTSALSVFPNKKFSGLKIRQKPYWDFQKQKSSSISELDLKVFLALERKGREAIEFDYGVTKYTTNQIIIKRKKDFKQLVIEGDYVISKLISMP